MKARVPIVPVPPTWHLGVGPVVWAVHFLAIYSFAALVCERQGTAGWITPAAVPWFVGAASVLASIVLLWTIGAALRGGRTVRAQQPSPPPQSAAREFVRGLVAAIAALVLVAVWWETLALVWLPVCG